MTARLPMHSEPRRQAALIFLERLCEYARFGESCRSAELSYCGVCLGPLRSFSVDYKRKLLMANTHAAFVIFSREGYSSNRAMRRCFHFASGPPSSKSQGAPMRAMFRSNLGMQLPGFSISAKRCRFYSHSMVGSVLVFSSLNLGSPFCGILRWVKQDSRKSMLSFLCHGAFCRDNL